MRVVIFGAGGVGGYVGGRLAQAGEDVVFIARGRHLAAMRQHGLRIESINGDFHIKAVQVTDDPSEVGQADLVVVAVKAWQMAGVLAAMPPLVGPNTFIVPLLNGVEAPRQLAARFGQEKVLGGYCHIISFVAEPGLIRHIGVEPVISFGELDNRRSKRVAWLSDALERANGVTPNNPPDILVGMWTKLLLISPWSCVAALTRSPAGVWRVVPESRQVWQQAMQEVVAVAQAHGVKLNRALMQETTTFVDQLPPEMTSSMQRDIQEGRPSELEAQCGAVVRLASEVGVETPTYKVLYGMLLPGEMQARGESPEGEEVS